MTVNVTKTNKQTKVYRFITAFVVAIFASLLLVGIDIDSEEFGYNQLASFTLCGFWVASFLYLSWSYGRALHFWFGVSSCLSFLFPFVSGYDTSVPLGGAVAVPISIWIIGTIIGFSILIGRKRETG